MSKISTYEVVPVPKLADKLIGTSVGGEIEDATYNFTLQELLDLFLPVIPANNLQGVLDYGNTATQDINLFGTITTTNLDVTDTANLYITYLNEETHIVGSVFDSEDSAGTEGQVLTSTEDGVAWVTLPPIFTPNLQQVLEVGNTSTTGIILDAGLEALDVDTDTATINTNITLDGTITDGNAAVGGVGQVLSSTGTGVEWVSLPVYTATSPLFLNPATNVISIQKATNTQNGYLSSSDWITFDGKQNAGNYITALTGEATASGPGAASVTLGNAAVIGKVLTGFNPTAGTINASDSILTAFGKTQSQINALVGGVQYKGTWNASTNVPTLQSSVGVQGNYYIVNVAGTTNLNGITDWQVGDWAIFSESTWQKVDNTESVVSVNGFTGAVSLTTDNIPEGTTNLYYLDSRARGALSFAAGSGAYNNVSGVITIPTDNSQILNGAGYITLGSLSANAPLTYNPLTGAFSIPKATTSVDGYLSATDWTTFNNKQNYLGGTGLVKSTAGTITYITDNSGNWNTAYDRSIVSAAVTGTTTKTLTLNEQDGNTITASWTDLDTGLTSVGVSMPSAFSVANSPLTSNGTIAITGAGTSLQYIDGTGALQTFPGLTGFVPYTGATTNVDLGEYGISAGYFQADLTPSGTLQVGRMQWNSVDGTMDLRLMGNNVTLQIGEENVTRVVNKSGIDLMEANYQVVRIRKVAEGGAQGQRLAVVLAQGNNENNSTEVLGIVTETILVNQEGFITNFGEVKQINTTGSLQGETWVDGDVVYLSATTPGQLTNIRPVAPNHAVIVGYVTYAHAVNGKIYVAVDTGYELGELHNVYAPSPADKASIWWNASTLRYENNTVAGILGYTPANAATELTINGTTYDLSGNRTWNVGTVTSVAALTLGTSGTDLNSSVANGSTTPVITLNVPTASAANRGALSAADWSTFNTKVGSVTASSPLASSGGSTPNITIQQASGSQNGYLSSTDWTTFNNKQAAGNYITSLTGEATASGPGAAAVTLNNASVTAKVLTGINITGGTVQATDTMLTAFGKLQNQINGLVGGSIYQGTWNASTNTPSLASGVGTKGYYYIVSVAGNTNLDGITDWFVGDWAIFDGTAWQQVDNTDAVVSVNGQTGAVSLTTDNIPEGATNQYFLNSRARAALSFTAGSGAYNSTTGVITIPTNTNQLTNGASFITLTSLSGTAPIQYNNTTGVISITQAGVSSNGYLSSTDWNTFNNKQVAGNYVTTDTVQTISALKTFTAKVTINTGGTDDQLQLVGTAPSVRLSNAVTGATINGFIAMAGAANNYIQGAVAGDMCLGNQNNGKILFGFGSGTATQKMSLDSSGNVVFAGSVTVGSTLSNGTYTYTLPGATGTLALTSALGNYLPLSGGQMTGNIQYNKNNSNDWFIESANCINGPLIRFRANSAASGYANRGGALGFIDGNCVKSVQLQWDDSRVDIYPILYGSDVIFSGYIKNAYSILRGDALEEYATASDNAGVAINYVGYNSGTSYFRNFTVYNGKGTNLFKIDGAANTATFAGSIYANGGLISSYVSLYGILFYKVGQQGNSGYLRWDTESAGTETGSNAGSNFTLYRYSDTGAYLGAPIQVIRSTGNVNFENSITANNNSTINGSGVDAFVVNASGSTNTVQFTSTGGAASRMISIVTKVTENNARIDMRAHGSTYGPETLFSNSCTNSVMILGQPVSGAVFAIGNLADGPLVLGTNNTEWVRILNTGKVGIKATNPSSALQIANGAISNASGSNEISVYGSVSAGDAAQLLLFQKWNSLVYPVGMGASYDSVYGSAAAGLSLYVSAFNGSGVTTTKALYINPGGESTFSNIVNAPEIRSSYYNGASYPYNTIFGSGADVTTSRFRAGSTTGYESYINMNNNIIRIGTGSVERMYMSNTFIDIYSKLYVYGNLYVGAPVTTLGNDGGSQAKFVTIGLDGQDYRHRYILLCKYPTFGNSTVNCGFRGKITMERVNGIGIDVHDQFDFTVSYGNAIAFVQTSYQAYQTSLVQLPYNGTQYLALYIYSAPGYSVAYIDAIQTNYGGWLDGNEFTALNYSTAQHSSVSYGSNTTVFKQAVTVYGSVTATSFFESSDSRLKNLIKDDYKVIGIQNIKPKLYIKDGREEVGYFAQDVQDILSTAVTKNDAGFLSLSYTQVHTAKIAVIEDEITILKKRVSELETQLNLN